MNEKYQTLTIELSEIINKTAIKFLFEKIAEQEEDASDLINLVLSAHLTSCFNLMSFISEEHPDVHVRVKDFIEKLTDSLKYISPVKDVRVERNKMIDDS
jgi:hypothetical protein